MIVSSKSKLKICSGCVSTTGQTDNHEAGINREISTSHSTLEGLEA